MTTQRRTNNAKSVYIKNYGPIPKEPNGRSYDIHHIDGNEFNDDPSNLIAVTIQEHYNIHYSRGDYSACYFMATQRMNKSQKEIEELAYIAAIKRTKEGKCIFTSSESPAYFSWYCEHCKKSGKNKGAFTRFHGDNCLSNPNKIRTKEKAVCRFCRYTTDYEIHLRRSHNDNCKKNPKNKKQPKEFICNCGFKCKPYKVYIERHSKKCKIGKNNYANI